MRSGAALREERRGRARGREDGGLGLEAVRRPQARRPQDPQRILEEVLRVHAAERPAQDVAGAAERVHELPGPERERHGVHCEIPAREVRADRASLDLGDVDRPAARHAEHARAGAILREEDRASVAGRFELARESLGVARDGHVDLGRREAEEAVAQGASDDPRLQSEARGRPGQGDDLGAPPQSLEFPLRLPDRADHFPPELRASAAGKNTLQFRG